MKNNFRETAKKIFDTYIPSIEKHQKNPKNMFLLGCESGLLHAHSKDELKEVSTNIVNKINIEFNLELKTVDAAQMDEFIFNYLTENL